MVQFNFMTKNHTVTQSTFPKPCVKMAQVPGGPTPVDSGFMPFNGTGTPPMMMVQVTSNATTPMWFYCRQKVPESHCGKGMTFSINPNQPGKGAKTQSAFKAAAIAQNGTTAATTGSVSVAQAIAAAATTVQQLGSTATNAALSASQSSNALMVQGTGEDTNGETCDCSCLCGASSFPNTMQGIGAMGGGIPGM